MGVFCQVLRGENPLAGFDYPRIVHVDILYEYPGAYTVIGQCAVGSCQLHDIIAEDKPCLIFRIGSTVAEVGTEQLAVTAVTCFEQITGEYLCLNSALEPHPESYLCPVHGSLLYDG